MGNHESHADFLEELRIVPQDIMLFELKYFGPGQIMGGYEDEECIRLGNYLASFKEVRKEKLYQKEKPLIEIAIHLKYALDSYGKYGPDIYIYIPQDGDYLYKCTIPGKEITRYYSDKVPGLKEYLFKLLSQQEF